MNYRISFFNRRAVATLFLVALWSQSLYAQDYTIKVVPNSLETASRKAKPKVETETSKAGDTLVITSDEWHGGAITLAPKSGAWPKALTIKIKTSDGNTYPNLERFSVTAGEYKVVGRFAPYARRGPATMSIKNRQGVWTELEKIAMPIRKFETHLQIKIPSRLLKANPKQMKIAWIYMYTLQ